MLVRVRAGREKEILLEKHPGNETWDTNVIPETVQEDISKEYNQAETSDDA